MITHTTLEELEVELVDFDLDSDEHEEVLEYMEADNSDFEVGCYRFIAKKEIDNILASELEGDTYLLGCFDAYFVANVTDLPVEMIQACQKLDAYDAVGKGIIATCGVEGLAEAYAREDGYGHHFATYDGEEHEIDGFYVFRIS